MPVAHPGHVVGGTTEERWFGAVNDLSRDTPWLHEAARLFAEYGVVLFGALLLLSWWWARRGGDVRQVSAALWAPLGVLIAVGVNQLLGAAVAEPRPYTALPGVLVLVPRSTDYAFPSDHAVMAGAVAAGVWLAHRRLGLLATSLALLMAATRVYVGAHFPLDVVAGLVAGAVVAVISYLAVRPLLTRLIAGLAGTPARLLLTAAPRPR
ncbi:phosphatase PAP2 family protein [Nocardioides sp. GXZ039]|uniref:phosphatase PAP2 family protein n=1 Tax=Nocardioides sp. GXZ039 TaxID=3136018 RepID=UPI0030F40D93